MPKTEKRTSHQASEDYERMPSLITDATSVPEPAQETPADTGLHSMSGPPLATADWVIASWQKALSQREPAKKPARRRAARR